MPRPEPPLGSRDSAATHDDVRRILGDIDERKVLEILSLRPSIAALEEAAIWASGDGDVLAKAGRPIAGVAAEILEIVTADEEEPPPTG